MEQIPFADDITCTVEGFARDKDLEFDAYYHDLPVWIVHERQQTERTRRLQLTAYFVGNELYVSLVPSIHIYVSANQVLVPKRVQAERFPVGQIVDEQGEFRPEKLRDQIEAAWCRSAALNFQPDELLTVDLPEITVERPRAKVHRAQRDFTA